MSRWLEDIRAERTPGTYPVAQAIYFQQNGSTEKDLFVAIEYGAINMILNAALRCVKVSHYETQATFTGFVRRRQKIIKSCVN